MGRGRYLGLAWPSANEAARDRAGGLGARLKEAGWRIVGRTDRLSLWVDPADPARVEALPQAAGFLIGRTWPVPGAEGPAGELPRSPCHAARRLAATRWGAYVAVLHGPAPAETAVFRDPCGDLDALVWAVGDDVEVVASDILDAPPWLRPPRLSLDWDRIAAVTALSAVMRMEVLFDGVEAVQPGMLQPLPVGSPAVPVWRPSAFVGVAAPGGQDAERELVRRVEACVSALAEDHGRILVEVSGGLDSAIVAGTLGVLGLTGRACGWINYAGDRPEEDESAYARAVTDRLGVTLTVARRGHGPLEEADFAELAAALRPALHAVDAPRDRDGAERALALGASGVFSGQGGDAVFFQMPSVHLAADLLAREGLRGLGSPVLAEVARRTRKPVWQVLAEAWRARGGRARLPLFMSPLVRPEIRTWLADVTHPWVHGEDGLPPAKRLQVQAIANAQLYRGDCRRRRASDLLFPLLAQPVVELCLSLPASELAGGAQDRRLARAAFADRLPDLVRERRSKGELGAHYGRMVAASRGFLEPYLAEGCLAGGGVLDPDAVRRHLEPEQLIRRPETGVVLTAVAVEAWVRWWQGRIGDSARAPRRPAAGSGLSGG